MATIGLTIQRDLFQHNDERLMALISVTKPQKKKKKVYFLAIVFNDSKRNHLIYLIKKNDQQFRKDKSWTFNELRVVDAKSDSTDTEEFELHFNYKQIYKWTANSLNEKYLFIQYLTRLSSQNVSLQKIQFLNIPKEALVSYQDTQEMRQMLLNGNNVDNSSANDYNAVDEESYQALTSREEADLDRLMSQCEFTIHNAEAFTEQLGS